MFRKSIAVLLCASVVLAITACGSPQKSSGDGDGKVKVSVSFNALYEFVTAIGGDKVTVSVIIPDGTEPHAFEPKANDLAALSDADIFVMNGLEMEPWAKETIDASKNPGLVVVDASAGVDTISTEDEHEDAHTEEHEEEHEGESEEAHLHEHGAYDPHIWLSPLNAVTMAGNIKDALIKADPGNSTYYETNYTTFSGKLKSLSSDFYDKFQTVENKSFVTGHAAFAYLCRDFGLIQNSVADVFAEGEPVAQQLAALVDYCIENNVTTIFSEALVSTAVSETLASEVGATVKPIYTMASSENGKSYLARMEENLTVIYESMAS